MWKIVRLVLSLVMLISLLGISVYFAYFMVEDGTLHLKRAGSHATLLRQGAHKIHHIQAQSLDMAVYTQGFAHAQDRLWQMEKIRRMTQGRLSEIFAEEGIALDKFSLTCGYYKTATETWETPGLLREKDRALLQAYSDGVNDFIDGVGLFSDHQTAKLFPPEIYLLGIIKPEPWHPIDVLATLRLVFFHLSFSWTNDLLRDIIGNLENGELRSMRDQLVPFMEENTLDLMSILNKDDMKQGDLFDEETIMEKYKAAKKIRDEEEEALRKKRKKGKWIPAHETGFQESRASLDDQQASNAWVIHGNYTKSGKPLLSSDPHLGTDANCFWIIQHLEFQQLNQNTEKNETRYLVGASIPGVPLIMVGRADHMSWGITNPLTDVSDLYSETVNEKGTQYLLDGKWHDFKEVDHTIKVKGWTKPIDFKLKYTHRGPVVDSQVITHVQALFGPAQIPVHHESGPYTLQWAGNIPGETLFIMHDLMAQSNDIFEFKEGIRRDCQKWISVPASIVMADDSGNIGYALLSPSPIRKNWYPYLGMNIIDGSTSKHDWEGITDLKNLPLVINPEKGYFISANNRIVPENSKYDFGAESISTTRGLRIREMIEEGIKDGKKFTAEDFIHMQNDQIDIIARDYIPLIINIAERALEDRYEVPFDVQDRHDIKQMLEYMREFKGDMGPKEIKATVYQYWNYFFYSALFNEFTTEGNNEEERTEINEKGQKQKTWSDKRRYLLADHYSFLEYYKRLIKAIHENKVTVLQNRICKYAFKDSLARKDPTREMMTPTAYKGSQYCYYNVARSFVEAKQFLYQKVSHNPADWAWGQVHVNEYPMLPWSMTPLKPIWHREVPFGGNMNTVSVSKTCSNRIAEDIIHKSNHAANFKMVIEFGNDDVPPINYMSIDTGMNGNLFAGNYFDMNSKHLEGDLTVVPTDFDVLERSFSSSLLHIVPLQSAEKPEL